MTTHTSLSDKIAGEYKLRRDYMIQNLRDVAKAMEQEAELLEKTTAHPMASWRPTVLMLERTKEQLDALRDVYPTVTPPGVQLKGT